MSASTRKKTNSAINSTTRSQRGQSQPGQSQPGQSQPGQSRPENSRTANQKQQTTDRQSLDYLSETLRPFVCLIFVLPILLTYELGAILLGNESTRSGLDVWTSSLLGWIGAGELFLLPLLTAFVLIFMHHSRNDRFGFHPSVITGMTLESFALALIVFCGAKAQLLFLTSSAPTLPMMWFGGGESALVGAEFSFWTNLVSFCGAGLYEELFFRLLMIPAAMIGLMNLGMKRIPAAAIAIVVTSLLFASVHYQILNPAGLPLEWAGFTARFLASVFFSLVFLFRGFGVAVGTHVAYDLLTLL